MTPSAVQALHSCLHFSEISSTISRSPGSDHKRGVTTLTQCENCLADYFLMVQLNRKIALSEQSHRYEQSPSSQLTNLTFLSVGLYQKQIYSLGYSARFTISVAVLLLTFNSPGEHSTALL